MYGNTEKVNIEDSSVIYSLEPGIYTNGKIVEVKKDQVGKDDEKKPVLSFMFETSDGKKHQHTEWEQTEDDKMNNQVARVGSYIRQIFPEYVFPGVASWEALRDHVVEILKDPSKVAVDFKVVANVYNPSKPKTQLPNYKGAVVASSKNIPLKFSATELSDNAVYKKILAGNYTPSGEIGGGDIPLEDISGGDPESIL